MTGSIRGRTTEPPNSGEARRPSTSLAEVWGFSSPPAFEERCPDCCDSPDSEGQVVLRARGSTWLRRHRRAEEATHPDCYAPASFLDLPRSPCATAFRYRDRRSLTKLEKGSTESSTKLKVGRNLPGIKLNSKAEVWGLSASPNKKAPEATR